MDLSRRLGALSISAASFSGFATSAASRIDKLNELEAEYEGLCERPAS